MAVSQNGWLVDPPRSSRTIPGSTVRIMLADGPAGDVLLHVLEQLDKRVEDIDLKSTRGEFDDWGYANRNVRGSTAVSNHASATAFDINATRHVLGARGTFTAAQVAEIRRILAEVDNVVRWGGDYVGRKDEMHFEINAPQAVVATVAARLKAGRGSKMQVQVSGFDNAALQSLLDFPMTVAGLDGKPQTASLKVWLGADAFRNADTRNMVIQTQAMVKAMVAAATKSPDVTIETLTKAIRDANREFAPRAQDIAGMLLPQLSQLLREELADAFDDATAPATAQEISDRVVARIGQALVEAAGQVAEVKKGN